MKTFKISLKAVTALSIFFGVLVVLYLHLKSDLIFDPLPYLNTKKVTNKKTNVVKEVPKFDVVEVPIPESVAEIEKKKNPDVEQLKAIWQYVNEKKYVCSDEEYLGGKMGMDGAYYLCKEKKFWPFPNPGGDRCLVYSFGIGGNFNFDDAIAKAGCEVHAFDPRIDVADGTVRDSGVIFHKTGIAESDDDSGWRGWRMRTLRTLMKELGHQNRVLDYLKVDTDKKFGEGFEDSLMKQILDNGMYQCVRQYAMEIHLGGPLFDDHYMNRCKTIYQQMLDLQKGGWLLYQTVDNIRGRVAEHPGDTAESVKNDQLNKKKDPMFWETHFVNTKLKGTCSQFL